MAGRGRIAAVSIELNEDELAELEGLTRRRKTAQGLARRARIVLLAAQGLQNKEIAARLGTDPNTVGKWRRRFAEHRCDGLYDEPRPGTPRKIGDDAIAETIRKTLEERPAEATHWSLRSMARGEAERDSGPVDRCPAERLCPFDCSSDMESVRPAAASV